MEWTRTKLCLTPISTLLDPAALSLVSQQAPQFLPWRQSTWSFKYSSNDFSGSSLFQLFPSSAIYLLMAFISAPSDTLCSCKTGANHDLLSFHDELSIISLCCCSILLHKCIFHVLNLYIPLIHTQNHLIQFVFSTVQLFRF